MFLISSLTLVGQQNSIFIGATGGGNLSKFKYTSDLSNLYSSTSPVFGLNGGAIFGLEIQNFVLSSGLQYVQKGSVYETDTFEDEFGTGVFSAKERLHYVSVPLHLAYRKYLTDRFALTIGIGPSFNFGVGGKIDESIEYFGSEEIEETNYKVKFGNGVNDDYKGMQVGFQLSTGFVYALNEESKLTFNVIWDSGVSDSFNKRYKTANSFFDTYHGDQMNRSTMFSIGYERHFTFGDRY
ncbi:MAG: hypothetical protein DHS20C18_26930 [Saprospiraceae bacterium]|nr:MAG: hypothetical protein DHS20C18_26930 [Saprospiraceae bacterium]